MSAFDLGQQVEIMSREHSDCLLKVLGFSWEDHPPLSNNGDATITNLAGERFYIEFKSEKNQKYGNLFLESWSNKISGRRGWLYTLGVDYLLYLFLEPFQFYVIDFQKLRQWAFDREDMSSGRIYDFPERRQSKYDQANDTWGFTVPIAIIEREVGFTYLPWPE